MQRRYLTGLVLIASGLQGCGSYVPDMEPFYEGKVEARLKVQTLVEHVHCHVRTAVQHVILDDIDAAAVRAENGLKRKRVLEWLDSWAAQVTLTLTVDEKSSLNPAVALNTVLPNATTSFVGRASVTTAQSFSLGLAGAFSTQATRKQTISYYLDFRHFTDAVSLRKARELRKADGSSGCSKARGGELLSDLKFKDTLESATLPAAVEGGIAGDYSGALAAQVDKAKKDVISHQVTFVVVQGGSITPTWKLVSVGVNPGTTPFLGAQRTNTQDLNITLGPVVGGQLAPTARDTALASQIGTAVSNAIKANP